MTHRSYLSSYYYSLGYIKKSFINFSEFSSMRRNFVLLFSYFLTGGDTERKRIVETNIEKISYLIMVK